MQRAASKFYGEQDAGRHGGPLHWTNHGNGVPFRGNGGGGVPILAPGEFDELPVVRDFQKRTFNLAEDKDSLEYSWVMDRIGNGLFQLHHIERWRTDNVMFVYVEWYQLYRILPKGHPRESNNGRSSSDGSAVGF